MWCVSVRVEFIGLSPVLGMKGSECEFSCDPRVLECVADFLVHHYGVDCKPIQKPIISKDIYKLCADSWDAEFIDSATVDVEILKSLLPVANFLQLVGLTELCAAKIATIIKGRPTEELYDLLNTKKPTAETVKDQ